MNMINRNNIQHYALAYYLFFVGGSCDIGQLICLKSNR